MNMGFSSPWPLPSGWLGYRDRMLTTSAKRLLVPTVLTLGALMLAGCGDAAVSPAAKASSEAAAASAAAAVAGSAGAASGSAGASSAPLVTDLAGSSWNLTAFADESGSLYPASTAPDQGTLTFNADGTFSGSTGCNRIAGTYTEDGGNLTMVPGPMTLKACSPDLTTQEQAVVAALPKVATFTANQTLELLSSDGIALLDYEPGTAGLAGTSWTATGINNGKQAVVSAAGVEQVTLVFGTDGTVSGVSACNNYTGSYTTTDPDGLTFGPLASTKKLCEDSLNQIEQEYLAALANVMTYQLEGSTLTLRDASGATQVAFQQAAA